MRKTWLSFLAGGLAVFLTAGGSGMAFAAGDDVSSVISGIGGVTVATGTVTFQVNMSVRLCEGLMAVGDTVSVPGTFNVWTPGASILEDLDGDSIYTGTFDIAEGTIGYKFHDGNDWESTPDRSYEVVAGPQTIPVVFFSDDDTCNVAGMDVPVTFQVDMSVKIAEGSFDPTVGEWVGARGSFNGWSPGDTLIDFYATGVYEGTMMLPEGDAIEYKYVIHNDDGTDTWEDNIGGNRMYTVPVGGGIIPLVWFDNDSVVSLPVTQNILLKTDMEAYFNMGWFQPSLGDSIQVRGAFNSWAGGTFCDDPLSQLEYEYLVDSYGGFSGDNFPYKFYIAFDEATAPTRFPGWLPGTDGDGWNYEHPAERGDGNRIFVLPNVNGDVGPDVYWYSDINPDGALNSPDTVRVTLTADMNPAVAGGFDPETDTVRVVWQDALWRSVQVLYQGAFPQVWNMTALGGNMYSLTFTVYGTTHYNMQYSLRYTGPLGEVTEGTGLGVQNPYRSRFIQPLGPNSFPTSYSAPVDSWEPTAPHTGESAPFNPLNSVKLEPELGQPVVYKLLQNYPNPFNPATRIKYAIPSRSHVTLKVYNILGQEVASLVNEVQEQGNYVAVFEANKLASGVYFYKLEAGEFSRTMKMLLMK